MFDARAAKLLAAGEHLTIEHCPGLRLEATASTRTWTYRYRSPVDGKLRQTKLGQWPKMPLPAAVAAWEKARTVRDAGGDPAAAKREAKAAAAAEAAAKRAGGTYTVRRLCEDYLAGHIDVARKAKGAAEVRRMFDTMLDAIATTPAADLTRTQAFELLEALKDVPVQASSLRRELGAAWDHAIDAGRVPDSTPNHWRNLMRGKLRSTGKRIGGESVGEAKRVLTDDELGELIRWLPNFSRLVADVLELYLWTGLRGSEIVAMEAHEVAEEEGGGLWWTIPKRKTKNARRRSAGDLRVPLIGRAAAIVQRRLLLTPSGFLFPSDGQAGHVEQKTIQTAVHFHQPYSKTRPESLRPRLAVTHWAPHDLRRTVRTLLAKMGCPNDVAEAVLGHVQPGVQGIYNLHAYDAERREWLMKLSTRLERLSRSSGAGASLKLAAARTTP